MKYFVGTHIYLNYRYTQLHDFCPVVTKKGLTDFWRTQQPESNISREVLSRRYFTFIRSAGGAYRTPHSSQGQYSQKRELFSGPGRGESDASIQIATCWTLNDQSTGTCPKENRLLTYYIQSSVLDETLVTRDNSEGPVDCCQLQHQKFKRPSRTKRGPADKYSMRILQRRYFIFSCDCCLCSVTCAARWNHTTRKDLYYFDITAALLDFYLTKMFAI